MHLGSNQICLSSIKSVTSGQASQELSYVNIVPSLVFVEVKKPRDFVLQSGITLSHSVDLRCNEY